MPPPASEGDAGTVVPKSKEPKGAPGEARGVPLPVGWRPSAAAADAPTHECRFTAHSAEFGGVQTSPRTHLGENLTGGARCNNRCAFLSTVPGLALAQVIFIFLAVAVIMIPIGVICLHYGLQVGT